MPEVVADDGGAQAVYARVEHPAAAAPGQGVHESGEAGIVDSGCDEETVTR